MCHNNMKYCMKIKNFKIYINRYMKELILNLNGLVNIVLLIYFEKLYLYFVQFTFMKCHYCKHQLVV